MDCVEGLGLAFPKFVDCKGKGDGICGQWIRWGFFHSILSVFLCFNIVRGEGLEKGSKDNYCGDFLAGIDGKLFLLAFTCTEFRMGEVRELV